VSKGCFRSSAVCAGLAPVPLCRSAHGCGAGWSGGRRACLLACLLACSSHPLPWSCPKQPCLLLSPRVRSSLACSSHPVSEAALERAARDLKSAVLQGGQGCVLRAVLRCAPRVGGGVRADRPAGLCGSKRRAFTEADAHDDSGQAHAGAGDHAAQPRKAIRTGNGGGGDAGPHAASAARSSSASPSEAGFPRDGEAARSAGGVIIHHNPWAAQLASAGACASVFGRLLPCLRAKAPARQQPAGPLRAHACEPHKVPTA
jgi:hypothetical protein